MLEIKFVIKAVLTNMNNKQYCHNL